MNDKERINEFSEPPRFAKVSEIRVCILEMQGANGAICNFLYAYPYFEESGGILKVYNPSYLSSSTPEKWKRIKEFDNKLILWQAFWKIINKALKENPKLRILYNGPILIEDGRRKGNYSEFR